MFSKILGLFLWILFTSLDTVRAKANIDMNWHKQCLQQCLQERGEVRADSRCQDQPDAQTVHAQQSIHGLAEIHERDVML